MKIFATFAKGNVPVAEQIKWKTVNVCTKAADGTIIFEQSNVEVPAHWSDRAAEIIAKMYFRKAGVPAQTMARLGEPSWIAPSIPIPNTTFGRETSAKQVFHRLAGCWTYWGYHLGYFDEQNAQTFYNEIYWMLAHQMAAPNSPQWFNTGLHWAYGIEGEPNGQWAFKPSGEIFETTNSYERPQVHACYIQPIADDLVNSGGIMDLWTREAKLFKFGSGTGTNFSNVRAKDEPLKGGGKSSGLMSFLKIGDQAAGAIKSGGTTRRAAKMVCLDLDHPEIEDFINWKVNEEAKAAAMFVGSMVISGEGYQHREIIPQAILDRLDVRPTEFPVFDCSWEGEAINTVSGQNSNNSVRVTDEFLRCVDDNKDWDLINRTDGKTSKTIKAKELWQQICYAAWASADPGVQFHDTINRWHTCAIDGPINASNPCCLVGDTLVDTSEGKIRIDSLERAYHNGQPLPFAFAFSLDDRMPVMKQIKRAWVAGETRDIVEIVTDKGITIQATPEHRFLTRFGKIEAGSWVQAKNLSPGMRLRKIGRIVNEERGYRCSISTRKGDFYQNRFMWEQVYGPIPNGYEVHHRDNDSTGDRISNLHLISEEFHQIYHSTASNNPRYIDASTQQLVEIFEEVEKIKSTRKNGSNGATYGNWNSYIRKNNLVGTVPLARGDGRIRGMEWDEFCYWIDEQRGLVNHRIVAVNHIHLEEPIKVYDIEVDGEHNFGVTSNHGHGEDSIIVHNSEYMFLDNTACNLASLNLVKFMQPNGELNIAAFEHTVWLWTIVLDISVSMASYPSQEIAQGSYNYRTLGLGYANLGGLLMRRGVPYDSDLGRELAAGITNLMHATSLHCSNVISRELLPFPRHNANLATFRTVLDLHKQHTTSYNSMHAEVANLFDEANLVHYKQIDPIHGFRNAQITLLAPTGTISYLMDCDTTGIEPEFALVKTKLLAGGGSFKKIVNPAIGLALSYLGYKPHEVNLITLHIIGGRAIETCTLLKPEHVSVFDCSNPQISGGRYLRPEAHVLMVAAVQPFLSGAVSKTTNLPNSATIDDVDRIYQLAHKLGVKSIALYRDGSKLTQPLNVVQQDKAPAPADLFPTIAPKIEEIVHNAELARGSRERLPWKRQGYTHKVKIDGQTLYLRTGEYLDGRLGEIFLTSSKEGSTARAYLEGFAKAISLALQFGVPLQEFIDAFTHVRFEPAGLVEGHENIKQVSSIFDFVFRDLAINYLDDLSHANVQRTEEGESSTFWRRLRICRLHHLKAQPTLLYTVPRVYSGETCAVCGGTLKFVGTCKCCDSCGQQYGGCG